MSDERPPDDLEPAQAELELDEIDDDVAEPEETPNDDVPPAVEATVGEPPSAELGAEPVADDEDTDESAIDADPATGDELEDLLDDTADSDVELDSDSDFERNREVEDDREFEDEAGFLVGDAAIAEPRRADLPTAWPDPIPVGSPAPVPTRFDGLTITPPLVILGSLVTLSFLLFVTIEPTPRWLLLFTSIIAVLGTDGALRQAWPRPFSRSGDADADSTPYLFLPALAAIAWPMLIEHNVRGYLVLPAALLAGAAFTAMLMAQLSSVRTAAPVYPLSRLASTAAVYFTAFALFSLSYVLDPQLPAAIAAVAVIGAMLGVELFREGQVDPLETLVFAGVTGVILAEARWAMYYVPVDGYLAGLALLLGFFLITGLLHSHLTRRLNNVVALEYGGIAAAGVLLVSVAAQAGLG